MLRRMNARHWILLEVPTKRNILSSDKHSCPNDLLTVNATMVFKELLLRLTFLEAKFHTTEAFRKTILGEWRDNSWDKISSSLKVWLDPQVIKATMVMKKASIYWCRHWGSAFPWIIVPATKTLLLLFIPGLRTRKQTWEFSNSDKSEVGFERRSLEL